MSADKLDTDALATEEMLKMFESMESSELEASAEMTSSADAATEEITDALADLDLMPIDLDSQLSALSVDHLVDHLELPEALDSIDAEIIEMPDMTLSLDSETAQSEAIDDMMPEEVMPEEVMPEEVMPEEVMPEEVMPETTTNPIANHLNAVVENAVQALQDWLALRQQSEESAPQQGLAQLDVLLDTVTQQQQHLAEQLSQAPKVDFSGMASALGVTLATPQALGWTNDQWRIKAEEVAHKTDDIAAMNAKLRKQLEQF